MSGMCGWVGQVTSPEEADARIRTISRPLQRFGGGDGKSLLGERSAVCVVSGHPSDIHRHGDLLVAVHGAPVMKRGDLDEHARQQGIARVFTECYLRDGPEALGLLGGAFAVAVVNDARNEAMLATDRSGTCPVVHTITRDTLVFASSADAVNLHPLVKPTIDPQSLYDYVYFHVIPAPATVYSSQRRLLPGQYVLFANGKADIRSYWQMRFVENVKRPFAELKAEFMQVLRGSVARAAHAGEVGAFLSGGTDSSTMAGLLGEVSEEPARTYSIGFQADGYDEIGYARTAARHFRTRHHEYYVTPDDVVNAIPQIASVHDQPFGNSSAVPTYYCAKLAKADGIDTLLGGDGGDELFGGNTRYATQYLYSLYSDLPVALRKRVIEPAVFLAAVESGIVGKVQRYIRSASQPMPARYDNYNLLERLGPATVFTAEFLDRIDRNSPLQQTVVAYRGANAQTLINRMLALDLKYTLADNDLPKVTRSCELAGVDVRFPMLDDAVVAFSAQLHPGLKLKGTRLRYFFKEALRGFLPEEIIAKRKHGFGLPFGPWLQTHKPLQQLVGDSLQDLKRRDIVRPQFIDSLLGELLRSHAGYYGTMAWVLMMLEQWFKRRPG